MRDSIIRKATTFKHENNFLFQFKTEESECEYSRLLDSHSHT